MFDPRDIAQKKEGQGKGVAKDWLGAFECGRVNLRFLSASPEELERVALACATPEQMNLMVRLLYQYARIDPYDMGPIVMMERFVDQSPFSLGEWIEGVQLVHQWLEREGREENLKVILNFLRCCVELPDVKSLNENFPNLVSSALEIYGVEKDKY